MEAQTKIVEIQGVKFEVDMRHAKVITNYKVGDNVKVLIKKYDDQYTSYPGVIVGFDAFKALPTITVAYLEIGYSTYDLNPISLNAKSKEFEICPANSDELPMERERVIDYLDREIQKKEEDLRQSLNKKSYFLRMFGSYCPDLVKDAVTV